MMWAAENDNVEVMEMLLGIPNFDSNAQDNDGWTALMRAADCGRVNMMRMMLRGPDHKGVNVKSKHKGWNALMLAAEYGHIEVVDILVNTLGIDVNAKDRDDRTALMRAACHGHAEILGILLRTVDIDANAKDNNGVTALMWANKGSVEVVEMLLESPGIDITTKDNFGQSVLGYVMSGDLSESQKGLLIRRMNFILRENLLLFLYGCKLCSFKLDFTSDSVDTTGSVRINDHDDDNINVHRSVVRCLEFHYWIRSTLEFLYIGDAMKS